MDEAESHRLAGNAAYQQADWPTALTAYTAGVRAREAAGAPPDRRLFSNRCAAWMAQAKSLAAAADVLAADGRPDGELRREAAEAASRAVRDATRCVKTDGRWSKSWHRLYTALVAAGRDDDAVEALVRGCAACPGDPDLFRAAAEAGVDVSGDGGGGGRGTPGGRDGSDASGGGGGGSGSGASDGGGSGGAAGSDGPRSSLAYSEQHFPGDAARLTANAAFARGDWDGAIASYTAAIMAARRVRAAPDRRALSNRSAAHLRKAIATDDALMFQYAVDDAEACVAAEPHWPKAWFRLGAAYFEDGRPAKARDVFARGLRWAPGDGDLIEGIREAERVIQDEGEETDYEPEDEDDGEVAGGGDGAPDRTLAAGRPPVSAPANGGVTAKGKDADAARRGVPLVPPAAGSESPLSPAAGAMGVGRGMDATGWDSDTELEASLTEPTKQRPPHPDTTAGDARAQGETRPDLPRNASSGRPPRSWRLRRGPPGSSAAGSSAGSDSMGGSNSSRGWADGAPGASSRRAAEVDAASDDESFVDEREADGPHGRPGSNDGFTYASRPGAASATGAAAGTRGGDAPSRVVVETELYDVLGVDPSANGAVIKKAYYLRAKECHPDRHPDDPEATAKFQALGDAYQVLSNEQTRATYDRAGRSGLTASAFEAVDPSTLFAMVFGSDQFTHLIGELQLASLATHVDDAGNAPSELTMTRLQRQRVGRLAAVLVDALQPWTNGDSDAFRAWAVEEAHRLSAANFGSALLHVIGYVYARKANIALGKSSLLGLPGLWKAVSYSTHKLNSQVRATSAASRVLHSQRRLHDRVAELNRSGRAITSAEAHRIACSMTEKAVELFWKMSVIDIQDTLDAVADTVLAGDDLPPMAAPARDALLAERARGLKAFGKILMAGSEASVSVNAGQQRRRRGAAASSRGGADGAGEGGGAAGGQTGRRRHRRRERSTGRRQSGNDRRRRRLGTIGERQTGRTGRAGSGQPHQLAEPPLVWKACATHPAWSRCWFFFSSLHQAVGVSSFPPLFVVSLCEVRVFM